MLAGLVVLSTRPAVAQVSMAGFWVLSSKQCVPMSSRCTAQETGPWKSQLAIDVQHDAILVSASANSANPMAPAHTDTFRIDGKVVRWLPGQRGISRSPLATNEPDLRLDQKVLSTRPLWPGESWTLSSDGKTLLHEYRWKQRGDSVYRMTWTYRRSAG
jgi:hypothetical protein